MVGPDFGTPTLGRPSKGAEGARSNRHGDAQERPEGFSELYNLDPAGDRTASISGVGAPDARHAIHARYLKSPASEIHQLSWRIEG